MTIFVFRLACLIGGYSFRPSGFYPRGPGTSLSSCHFKILILVGRRRNYDSGVGLHHCMTLLHARRFIITADEISDIIIAVIDDWICEGELCQRFIEVGTKRPIINDHQFNNMMMVEAERSIHCKKAFYYLSRNFDRMQLMYGTCPHKNLITRNVLSMSFVTIQRRVHVVDWWLGPCFSRMNWTYLSIFLAYFICKRILMSFWGHEDDRRGLQFYSISNVWWRRWSF